MEKKGDLRIKIQYFYKKKIDIKTIICAFYSKLKNYTKNNS